MAVVTWDLHSETVAVVRVEQGPPVRGVPATTTVEEELPGRYNVQPVGTSESVGLERVVTSRWRVSGPLTDRVRAGDRIKRANDDAVYDVEGRPQHFTGGALDHSEWIISRQE